MSPQSPAHPRTRTHGKDRRSLAPELSRLLEQSDVMAWMADAKGGCTFVNSRMREFTGARRGGYRGDGWLRNVHPADRQRIRDSVRGAVAARRPYSHEYRLRSASGEYRYVHDAGLPLVRADGTVEGYIGSSVDVTEQREPAETAVRLAANLQLVEVERDRQLALLNAVLGNIQDGVMAEAEDGRIILVNAAFARMFDLSSTPGLAGTSALDLRERLWRTLVTDVDEYRDLTMRLRQERQPQLGFEIKLKDGRVFDRDYIPVLGPDGAVMHIWHYREVTERRVMEGRLRESRRRLRALSAHAEQAREEERRRLARTLHDDLGQLFSSIKLELAGAIAQFREISEPRMRPIVDRLQAAAGLTDLAMSSMRAHTVALRPPILDHLGLVPAIRWAATLFTKRTGIRCYVRARPASFDVPDSHVTALYRILLAALENAQRHADAGTVWVYLTRRRGLSVMEVRDNGRGITDAQINNPETMGLLGMRERALALGGEVRITGGRREGTRVRVILPDDAERS